MPPQPLSGARSADPTEPPVAAPARGPLRFAELTWTELDRLPRERCLGLLPVGAVEAHGPHLAVSTDRVIAEAMAEAGGRLLARGGWIPLILPTIDYVAAPFAAAFPGTLSVSPDTVRQLIVDLAAGWRVFGGRAFVLANAHLDPAHVGCLRQAQTEAVSKGMGPVIFPDVTRRPWALRLTDEFRSGACHAGRYETSIVLACRPDLVRMDQAVQLEDNPRSLSEAIRAGKESFEEAGGPLAYFGDPAAATVEEGRETIERLGAILADAVLAELGDPE